MENSLFPKVDYLRISITDRCNLRCFYCQPSGEVPIFHPHQILSYEEILQVVQAAAKVGFRKIRLTGGEPLVRRDLHQLISRLLAVPGIEEVTLTTNGVLLEDLASSLFTAGLRRINVSLDTLHPLKFYRITGNNFFHRVRRGLEKALALGFEPIKINMVVIRGINDDELEMFARWSLATPFIVRFIEFMPIGPRNGWHPSKFVSIAEIGSRLNNLGTLSPLAPVASDGPAQVFLLNSSGKIGLIGPLSHCFCQSCNRMRLTPEGRLRPCLLSDQEIDVRGLLRGNGSEDDLVRLLDQAVLTKSRPVRSLEQWPQSGSRGMSRIGG
ncbi:MAG: GTP 3',8-cyclase MoaA [Deltaproteobacteria bacterium]|nr:GTP 3',8-cyclase MoaA [Deltaproteobacteria bacterium]